MSTRALIKFCKKHTICGYMILTFVIFILINDACITSTGMQWALADCAWTFADRNWPWYRCSLIPWSLCCTLVSELLIMHWYYCRSVWLIHSERVHAWLRCCPNDPMQIGELLVLMVLDTIGQKMFAALFPHSYHKALPFPQFKIMFTPVK